MEHTDRFEHTNGITLHTVEHPGGQPTLVLMPGLTANARAFDGLVQAGLSPRFRVLALDLRGRGQSDAPVDGYRMADHAADVLGLLDALGLERAVLVGHSFGGLLGLYLAATAPDCVERLVVLDAGLSTAHPRVREQIQPSLARLGQVYPSWEAYLALLKQAPYFDGWWNPTIESYFQADVRTNDDGTVQARSRPDVIEAAMEGILAEDWRAHLTAVRQPVLLINATGAYGPPGAPPILSREDALATTAALADARYIEVPGNHITMLYGASARQIVDEIAAFAAQ